MIWLGLTGSVFRFLQDIPAASFLFLPLLQVKVLIFFYYTISFRFEIRKNWTVVIFTTFLTVSQNFKKNGYIGLVNKNNIPTASGKKTNHKFIATINSDRFLF
jgi:hypothetical protein